MNDQQILEYIAKTPDMRAVQLADKFDKELIDASNALRALVDVGDVVRHAGIGPNGQPAQMYNLSDEFKRSLGGKALMGKVAGEALAPVALAAPTPAAPAVVNVPAEAASTTPVTSESLTGQRTSPTQLALNYLVMHGSATDGQLREAMGLRAGQYPSAYLVAAVKAGKVNKDGREWKPGPAGPGLSKQPPFGQALNLPGAHPPKAKPVPPGAAAVEVQAASVPEPAMEPTAPTFRCGLWSDGVLELQRDGELVAQLTQHEGEVFSDFLDRMREATQQA